MSQDFSLRFQSGEVGSIQIADVTSVLYSRNGDTACPKTCFDVASGEEFVFKGSPFVHHIGSFYCSLNVVFFPYHLRVKSCMIPGDKGGNHRLSKHVRSNKLGHYILSLLLPPIPRIFYFSTRAKQADTSQAGGDHRDKNI
jgi:hypothetical protein